MSECYGTSIKFRKAKKRHSQIKVHLSLRNVTTGTFYTLILTDDDINDAGINNQNSCFSHRSPSQIRDNWFGRNVWHN